MRDADPARFDGGGGALVAAKPRLTPGIGSTTPRTPLLFTYRIDQMPPGKYTVEIWDPLSGAVIGSELTSVGEDGVLTVDLVPMSDELAIRVGAPDWTKMPHRPADADATPPTAFAIATNTPVPTASPHRYADAQPHTSTPTAHTTIPMRQLRLQPLRHAHEYRSTPTATIATAIADMRTPSPNADHPVRYAYPTFITAHVSPLSAKK